MGKTTCTHGPGVRKYADGKCVLCRREWLDKKWKDPIWAAQQRKKNLARSRAWLGLPEATRPAPVICECCGKEPLSGPLHLDHDHTTGAFRGWLCKECNMAIGKLGDTLDGIERARAYLLRAELS
jgi:Recombination endonuclease VII